MVPPKVPLVLLVMVRQKVQLVQLKEMVHSLVLLGSVWKDQMVLRMAQLVLM